MAELSEQQIQDIIERVNLRIGTTEPDRVDQ